MAHDSTPRNLVRAGLLAALGLGAGLSGCRIEIHDGGDRSTGGDDRSTGGDDRSTGGDDRSTGGDDRSTGHGGATGHGGGDTGAGWDDADCSAYEGLPETPATLEAFAEEGPYGFATRDFVFVDYSRPTPPNDGFAGTPYRILPTRVWYPARPGLAASPPPDERVPVACGGPFPMLAYAHGLTSTGANVRFYAEHMASHGYIMVFPQFPLSSINAPGGPTIADVTSQPGDLAFVMRQVEQLGGPDADLAEAADTRRGIVGFSAGGLTVLLAAYHPFWAIEGIQAAVAMAPLSCFLGPGIFGRSLPTMIIAGTADELVPPEGPRRMFAYAPPPVTLVELIGGTHSGFLNVEVPFVLNTDTIECERLLSFEPEQADDILAETISRGAGPDAFDPEGCPELCGERLDQTMGATRQLELTNAAILAHFEATLRGREDAAFVVTHELAGEPDVRVEAKR
uniref:Uncharacterized protein n=1 Tax=Sorangium cellulosum TaxID=56 RepID=A0A3S5GY50_SORCE|nr:hypothetical protein [Sorangium cellulosum]